MKNGSTRALILIAGMGIMAPAATDPLTEETGNAILKELREVRELLQRMDRRDNSARYRPRQAPAAARVSVSGRNCRASSTASLVFA